MAAIKYKSGSNWVNALQVVYPVGAVYITTSSTSPASIVGGTWSQKKSGLLACAGTSGFAAVNKTGGSTSIKVSNLPGHRHTFFMNDNASGSKVSGHGIYNTSIKTPIWGWNGAFGSRAYTEAAIAPDSNASESGLIDNYDGGGAYYPAHYSVNVWVRTA